jgi:hypothetical protein
MPELDPSIHAPIETPNDAAAGMRAPSAPHETPLGPVTNGSPGGDGTSAGDCPTCSNPMAFNATSYVYAIGRVEPRFPRLSVEKEFAQATGRADTVNLGDRQALHKVLSDPHNRYLARQLCWVMMISDIETYLLYPRDPIDLHLLVETLRPTPRPTDLDLVIGLRGPLAKAEICNGLIVPIVAIDQLYSFDREALINSIPRPEKTPPDQFRAAAEEVFDRLAQMVDNAGATDEHRALNYLTVRYPAIFVTVADAHARNQALTSVEVRPSALSGVRKIVEVIFCFTNRATDVVEKFFVRVDVTEEFPFLVTKMSPYFDH